MKLKILITVMAAALALSSGLAIASPISSNPPAVLTKNSHVSHKELVHFARTIRELQPINLQAHKIEMDKNISNTMKEKEMSMYGKKAVSVIKKNHLSPVAYETLVHKAETDPNFAKRAEKVIRLQ